jgi:hypothetical protein
MGVAVGTVDWARLITGTGSGFAYFALLTSIFAVMD